MLPLPGPFTSRDPTVQGFALAVFWLGVPCPRLGILSFALFFCIFVGCLTAHCRLSEQHTEVVRGWGRTRRVKKAT